MSDAGVDIKFRINFPVIIFAVGLLHALIFFGSLPDYSSIARNSERPSLKIRRVKTAKVEHANIKAMESVLKATGARAKSPVSLKDLAIPSLNQTPKIVGSGSTSNQRPGSRPEVAPRAMRSMNKISLKGQEFKDYSKSFPSGGLAISDMISETQKISDAVVSIEVPEGINPDELNEYELKFYGFQRRTAISYINSILKNLDKFQKKHPRYKMPTAGRVTMTARVTYDNEGNVTQIKMIRWTHVNEVQGLFEDIVKGIDQLHNPPRELWEKTNEFSMFYTLEILNG